MSPRLSEYLVFIHCPERHIYVEADVPEEIMFDIASDYEAPFSQGLIDNAKLNTGARMLGMSLTNQLMTAQVWQGSTNVQFSIPLVFQAETNATKEVIEPIRNLLRLTMPIENVDGGLLEAPGPSWDIEKVEKAFNETQRSVINQSGNLAAASSQLKDTVKGVVNSLKELDVEGAMKAFIPSVKMGQNIGNSMSVPVSRGLMSGIKNNISLSIGKYLYFPSVVITDVSQTATSQPERDTGVFMRSEVQVTFRTFMVPTQRDLDTMYPAYQIQQNIIANGPEGTH